MDGTLVTDGVTTDGTILLRGMVDVAVNAGLIMAGIMVEDFAVTHIMAVVLIMDGTTVDTMVEIDGETDLIIMDTTMVGVGMEDFTMQIIVGILIMEVEDTTGQIDIIEQQIAHASE